MQKNTKQGILVVNDEKTNLDVLNHILKEEYTVYVAKNGAAALNRVQADCPDLILLDILMPDMSGFEVLKKLKENDDTRNIPVVFITGLTSAQEEEKGFRMGAADYITKPFNNAVVKARIRNQMQAVRQLRLIEKMVGVDPLTEVSGRAGFERHLATEWERAVRDDEPISLLCLDVDSFRQYNDTYGYIQGNVMLQEMVKVFPQNLRRSADFVARLGGGKFAALLPNTDRRGASAIAEEIRRTVAGLAITRTGSADAGITVSIGVAERWPVRGGEEGDILAEAENELRRAKQLGRNRVCVKE